MGAFFFLSITVWIVRSMFHGFYSHINFLVGVVGNISACHADARGSIPRLGVFLFADNVSSGIELTHDCVGISIRCGHQNF